jgi:Tripartite tricarboxylate transporter family receptor
MGLAQLGICVLVNFAFATCGWGYGFGRLLRSSEGIGVSRFLNTAAVGKWTLTDFVPGYDASYWVGLGAPKSMPAEFIDTLNREINAALADAKVKVRFADLGGTALPGSPGDFGKLIAAETEKWAKVIRAANIKAE